jgi:cyclophilin family peptidyl-prolyl cis-trans isomerase
VQAVRERLLPPLARAIAARPDLVTLRWVRGGLLRQLALVEAGAGTGREGPAAKTLEAADADQEAVLAAVPGFREARFALDESLARRWTEPGPTAPSDYEAALAHVKAEGARLGERSVAARIAEAVLRYRRGEFAEATALFEPLLEAYPLDDETRDKAKRARSYVEAWGQELGFRKADAAKGDLPRVKIVTSKGDVLVELFEDDAPNSVRNFVFLARKGHYDGTVFHRVIPFFMAQGGGFRSAAAAAAPTPGAGGPGYAIKTEPSRRKPFRGVIAMARGAQPDTEGSQFFLTTGTAGHLEGEYSIFGRVLEGQDVVDRLVLGDVVRGVEVVRVREGRDYRPKGLDGKPVKDPK